MGLVSEKDKANKLKKEEQWQIKVDAATNWQITTLTRVILVSESTLPLLLPSMQTLSVTQ